MVPLSSLERSRSRAHPPAHLRVNREQGTGTLALGSYQEEHPAE